MVQPRSGPGSKHVKTHHSRGVVLGGPALHPEKARVALLEALEERGFALAQPGAEGSKGVSLHIGDRAGFYAHFADPDRHAHALGIAVARALNAPLSVVELRGSAPEEARFAARFSLALFDVAADGSVSMGAPPRVPPPLLLQTRDEPFATIPDELAYQERLAEAEGLLAQELLSSALPERDVEVLGVIPPALSTPLRLRELADAKVVAHDWEVEDGPHGMKTLRLKAADGSRRISLLTPEEAEVVLAIHHTPR